MTTQPWRPLGTDTEDKIAAYDALHPGVPDWMKPGYWAWVEAALVRGAGGDGYGAQLYRADADLITAMGQELQVALPVVSNDAVYESSVKSTLAPVIAALMRIKNPLAIADYLLYRGAPGAQLDDLLARCKSAYKVGQRAGHPGLEERVANGVQDAADDTMQQAGAAGVRLAEAWGELYGLNSDPSKAYALAIKAVEDAAAKKVSPLNDKATLGTVIRDMENQKSWSLPMTQDPTQAPSGDVLLGMMRLLWHGQHDRHGGQVSGAKPAPVTKEEAAVAVGLAVTLVHWFHSDLPARTVAP